MPGKPAGRLPQASDVQDTLEWLVSDWDRHLRRVNKIAGEVHHAIECFEMNRFEGFRSEEALMPEGLSLMRENKLWAALIFPDMRGLRGETLPPFVRYKIRMDARKVDSTKKIRDRYAKCCLVRLVAPCISIYLI